MLSHVNLIARLRHCNRATWVENMVDTVPVNSSLKARNGPFASALKLQVYRHGYFLSYCGGIRCELEAHFF